MRRQYCAGTLVVILAACMGCTAARTPVAAGETPYAPDRPRTLAAYAGAWHEPGGDRHVPETVRLLKEHGFNTFNCKIGGLHRRRPGSAAFVKKVATLVRQAGLQFYIYLYEEGNARTRPADSPYPAFVSRTGKVLPKQFCLYVPEVWTDALFPTLFYLAELSKEMPIAGVKLDIEHIQNDAVCHCDRCWSKFAAAKDLDATVGQLPADRRHAWLTENGQLQEYADWQEVQLDTIVKIIRAKVDAINPDLQLGLMPMNFGRIHRPFLRRLATARAPAVFEDWTAYYGGFRQAVIEKRKRAKSLNPHNLVVAWLMVISYMEEDFGAHAYHSAIETDGYNVYAMNMLTTPPEKLPPGYQLPIGAKQEDYWKALSRTNVEIGKWLASQGRYGTTLVLKQPPTPVRHTDYVAPMELPDLVPISDEAPEIAHAKAGIWWRPGQAGQKFYIYANNGDKIRAKVWNGRPDRNIPVIYLLSAENGRDLKRGTVGPGKTELITAAADRDGIYCLTVGAESVWMTVQIENPFAVAGTPVSLIKHIAVGGRPVGDVKGIQPLYFHVPKGTKSFTVSVGAGGPGEDAWLQVFAPDGKIVVDKADGFDRAEEFTIKVPEGADGKAWRVEIKQPDWGYLEDVVLNLKGVPPYVSVAPERLLIPAR